MELEVFSRPFSGPKFSACHLHVMESSLRTRTSCLVCDVFLAAWELPRPPILSVQGSLAKHPPQGGARTPRVPKFPSPAAALARGCTGNVSQEPGSLQGGEECLSGYSSSPVQTVCCSCNNALLLSSFLPSLPYFLCPKLLLHPHFLQGEDGLPVQGCWNKVKQPWEWCDGAESAVPQVLPMFPMSVAKRCGVHGISRARPLRSSMQNSLVCILLISLIEQTREVLCAAVRRPGRGVLRYLLSCH